MDRTRRNAVVLVVGLLLSLPVAVIGAPSVLRLTEGQVTRSHDARWPALDPRTNRGLPVRITGSVPALLAPGVSSPIALKFMNPNSQAVSIRRVRVTVVRVIAPNATAAHPCTRLDFEIRQMPRLTLRIPAGRVVTLSGLRVPQHQWATFGMRNRPVNQDGCKGARLKLGYGASAPRVAG